MNPTHHFQTKSSKSYSNLDNKESEARQKALQSWDQAADSIKKEIMMRLAKI